MLYSITGISFTYVLISLGMNLARNSTCNMKQSGTKTWRFGCVHCVIFGYHGFETALYSSTDQFNEYQMYILIQLPDAHFEE